jgi:hypothetical protein
MTLAIRYTDQFIDASGAPIVDGYMYIGEHGLDPKLNPLAIFTDETYGTPLANPVRTDSFGRPTQDIFFNGTLYSYMLENSANVIVEPARNRAAATTTVIPYAAGTDFAEDALVSYDGLIWTSLQNPNLGNTPVIGSAYWGVPIAGLDEKADLAGAAFTGPVFNIKTNTALADSGATLTAAQLIGGEFTITPTVARTLTTDTAANIIAGLTGSVDNSSFEFTVINLAAFDVSIAAGTGVTLVGNMVVNNGSTTFRIRRLTSSTVSVTRLETGVKSQVLIIQDQKAFGVTGGASVAGTQVRDLNTIIKNTISGASLSTNQITLPAGEYEVTTSAPAFIADNHSIEFYNFTDGAKVLYGTNEYCGTTALPQTRSFIDSGFTITAEKVFELHHVTQTAFSYGLGNAINREPEVYAQIKIKKVG